MPSNPAKNAVKALGRVITAATQGESLLVDAATVESRDSTCKQCPSHEPGLNRCRECGCFLSLKVQLTTESCPLGKWENTVDESKNPKTS
jgi:hypothetical protein